MFRRLIAAVSLSAAASVFAADAAPDAFVLKLSNEVIDAVKADKAIQSGDVARIRALVDSKVMPNVNLQRMVVKSVGPPWRGASAEQQKRLSEEFKTYLINTYSGALTQVKDQSVHVKPLRAASEDDLVVRTEVRGRGEPIQLDYRLEKNGDGWKIFDVNVSGFWIVEAYKGQFAKDLSTGGMDALINRLTEKNKSTAVAATKN